MIRFTLLAALALLLAGCSPLTLVNGIAPDHGFDIRQGIAYGPHERQQLDIYEPQSARADAPVIVFFYGGSWRNGERQKYRFVGQALSARGYTTVIPDYRLYPEVQFPDFVDDGAAAVAWARNNLLRAENGIILIGHSAGAHMAALIALDERYLATKEFSSREDLLGMIGLAGPYAFEPQKFRRFRGIFATAQPPELSQPVYYARGDAPPFLLFHGSRDTVVWPIHSQLLEERIDALGGRVARRELDDVGHYAIVLALSEPFAHLAPDLLPSIEKFIQEQI